MTAAVGLVVVKVGPEIAMAKTRENRRGLGYCQCKETRFIGWVDVVLSSAGVGRLTSAIARTGMSQKRLRGLRQNE